MTITAIKQQVKRSDRYSVYLDGVYSFSVGENELLKLGLHTGQDISAAELVLFQQESEAGKLLDKTLNLLSIRPRSEWEVRDYLRRKQAAPEISEIIVNKLTKNKYLNDEQFARLWVENRRLLKPTSRRKLTLELKQKRINSEIIEAVLADDKSAVDEREILRTLVEKKRHRYPDNLKLMQYLARQGYGYEDIKAVLSESSESV